MTIDKHTKFRVCDNGDLFYTYHITPRDDDEPDYSEGDIVVSDEIQDIVRLRLNSQPDLLEACKATLPFFSMLSREISIEHIAWLSGSLHNYTGIIRAAIKLAESEG